LAATFGYLASDQIRQIAEGRVVLGVAHQRQMVDHQPQAGMALGEPAEFGQQPRHRHHRRHMVALGGGP
jgi:hypothetical protein